MRRTGLLALATLSVLCLGTVTPPGKTPTGKGIVEQLLDSPQNSTYHKFTDEEYLRPRYYEPKATFVPTFHDGDTSFVNTVVAVWDSVRNSTGRFADSSWAGADLRATVAIMPTVVGVGAQSMTAAQVKTLAGRQKFYEVATHGPDTERLGPIGLDGDDAQVAVGGVTGRSKLFLQTALGIYQDSLQTWGLEPARTHIYSNYRMTLGEQMVWRQFGYYQAIGVSNRVGQDFSNVQTGQAPTQRNDDEFVKALWNRQARSILSGFHTIGERFDPFDVGQAAFATSSGAGGGAEVESLKVAVDMAMGHGDIFNVGFHTVTNDTAGTTIAMSVGAFYELTYFLASRVDEGGLQVKTAEQSVAMMRGIRDGELVQHRGFKLPSDFTYTSAVAAATTEPLGGFPPSVTSALAANWYVSVADTFAAAPGTSPTVAAFSVATPDTVRDEFAATSSIDSLSYGSADSSGNFIHMDMLGGGGSRSVILIIRTSGCEARALRISVQTMQLKAPGWDQDVFLGGKFGQFTEIWEDNVNSGGDAYEIMSDLIGSRITQPLLSSDIRVARVRPQFMPIFADTSVSTPVTITQGNWYSVVPNWQPPSLRPYWLNANGSESDLLASFGNPVSLTATAGTADDRDDNWQGMDKNNPVDHYFYVPINRETDYVYCAFQPQASVAMGAAGGVAFLNISAQPVR